MITKNDGSQRREYRPAPMPDTVKEKIRARFGEALNGLPYVTWDTSDENNPSYVGLAIMGMAPVGDSDLPQTDWYKIHLDFTTGEVAYEVYHWGNELGLHAEINALAPTLPAYQTSTKYASTGELVEYTYYFGVLPESSHEHIAEYQAILDHADILRVPELYGVGIKVINGELLIEGYYRADN